MFYDKKTLFIFSFRANKTTFTNLTISYSPNSNLIHDILCGSVIYLIKEYIANNPNNSIPSFIRPSLSDCDFLETNPLFQLVLNGQY